MRGIPGVVALALPRWLRRCAFVLIASVALAPVSGWCGAIAKAVPRTILVLGDSLAAAHNLATTQGWVHLLSLRLNTMAPGWSVINASISGETSVSGRHRLGDLLEKYRPALLVLELGANDGLRGLPLPALRANLDAMIVQAQASHARVLLLGIELPLNYGPQYRDGLRAIYAELARKRHVALVPFLLRNVALDPEKMQDDGLHPSAAGEPVVLDTVWEKLHPLLH